MERRGLTALTLAALATSGAACLGQIADTPPGPERVPDLVAGPAQIRLLSASEYRNTIQDLLGVTASTTLTHGDHGNGFDTGASTTLDENLMAALLDEAERIARLYVSERLQGDFPCAATLTDECAGTIIDDLGRRAFRRPVGEGARGELLAFFTENVGRTGSRAAAAELLLQRLLMSPRFLYRSEIGLGGVAANGLARLDHFEVASAIAYAITGSMPDEPVLADAAADVLDEGAIRAHVARLLAGSRGRERLVTVIKEWLRVTELDAMAEHPEDYPKLPSPALGASLRDELHRYVETVLFEGERTLPALLGGSFTVVDANTAPLYGVAPPASGSQRIGLDPTQRRGILTLASVMSVHASVQSVAKDRPIIRGLLIKNQLLCEDVGLPSGIDTAAAADKVADAFESFDALTTREQYEAMMQQGAECQSCHAQFMPLGFAFGRYDALGRFVTHHGERAIDPAVQDVPLGGDTASFTDALALIDELVDRPETSACFARNIVRYLVGTSAGEHVDALTEELSPAFAGAGYDIGALFESALVSPSLQVRRRETQQ